VILTPKQCSTTQLRKALADADNKFGKNKPQEIQKIIEAIKVELTNREAA
jgi:hypothetical protein